MTMGASSSAKSFKRLTPTEMEERRGKGLCYNCDEKFVPGHQRFCQRIFMLQVEPDDDDLEEANADATISLLALIGIRKSQMMQLPVMIHGIQLMALIDSGSTHNFIAASSSIRLG